MKGMDIEVVWMRNNVSKTKENLFVLYVNIIAKHRRNEKRKCKTENIIWHTTFKITNITFSCDGCNKMAFC